MFTSYDSKKSPDFRFFMIRVVYASKAGLRAPEPDLGNKKLGNKKLGNKKLGNKKLETEKFQVHFFLIFS